MTSQPEDAVQKSTLHFLKFYFNLRFFLHISSNMASFSLFFKFNIRFKKNIFWDLRPKQILFCVSQELIIVTLTPQSPRWKLTILHNEPACPIRKS